MRTMTTTRSRGKCRAGAAHLRNAPRGLRVRAAARAVGQRVVRRRGERRGGKGLGVAEGVGRKRPARDLAAHAQASAGLFGGAWGLCCRC